MKFKNILILTLFFFTLISLFIALNKKGEYGAYSVYEGFNYALKDENTKLRKEMNKFLSA